MFLAVEMWKESQLSQSKFCNQEGISFYTFTYWYRKYKVANVDPDVSLNKSLKTFVPIEVSSHPIQPVVIPGQIEVTFPNGMQLSCPVDMDIQNLKTLLGI